MMEKRYYHQKTCIFNQVYVIIMVVYFGWYRNEPYRRQMVFHSIIIILIL